MSVDGERTSWIDRYLVSAVLVTVAGLQLLLAHYEALSPWKGGGFGMFGSVDSPSMRVLEAEGFDAQGTRYRVDGWSPLEPREKRSLQSFPQPESLQQLAQRLVESEFVASNAPAASTFERLRRENPGLVLRYSEGRSPVQSLYRSREPGDPALPADQVHRFEKVRLRMWRIRFDGVEHRLWLEPLTLPITATAEIRL